MAVIGRMSNKAHSFIFRIFAQTHTYIYKIHIQYTYMHIFTHLRDAYFSCNSILFSELLKRAVHVQNGIVVQIYTPTQTEFASHCCIHPVLHPVPRPVPRPNSPFPSSFALLPSSYYKVAFFVNSSKQKLIFDVRAQVELFIISFRIFRRGSFS